MMKMTPTEMLNRIREKAKIEDKNDFSKSIAIRLKAGRIKFQLLAESDDTLFKTRVQHMIPTIPHEDDKNEKWIVADCKGNGCPVCSAASAFKKSDITVEKINEAYKPKFPYKNVRALFTQPEHYLLCARIFEDKADEGSYLPKDEELGSTQLIQFSQTALKNLINAYEDFKADFDGEEEDVPPLFAIFNGDESAKSLVVSCRITMQPYSCNFAFNTTKEVKKSEIDEDKLALLEESKEVPEEHYEKCVKRINAIKNYFVKSEEKSINMDNVPFNLDDEEEECVKPKKKVVLDEDDDFNLDDML